MINKHLAHFIGNFSLPQPWGHYTAKRLSEKKKESPDETKLRNDQKWFDKSLRWWKIVYRKPANVTQKFICIQKLAPEGTTFKSHWNKFQFYRS